jgi:two-component system, cell cycle sensor histidine kinase PleC
VNALSSVDEPSQSAGLHETLELRLLETAARYLYVNLLPLPLAVVGLGILFWHWRSLDLVVSWACTSLAAWMVLALLLRQFLNAKDRARHRRAWTAKLAVALFVAGSCFACAVPLFWVADDRLNNVLLYVFIAAAMASASGQSAPARALAVANLTPYGVVFVTTPLLHEKYPFSLGFAALDLVYIGLIVMFSQAVRRLAHEMLLLREQKRALIDRLEDALFDATVARKRAESASRAKSQFLANMSHELRTPLNAVLGFSEVIRDRIFGDGALVRYSDYAGSIHTSGTHLLGLINDVLDLSKIEAGKLELLPERFDLAGDAAEALRLVEPQAARKQVRLVREIPEQLSVFADKRALRQIAVNLLANAVKFTPQGGTVTLSLCLAAGGSVALSVSDTGVGIRPEDMSRVLESFGQGRHDITPGDEHGTGLGLAIAKSLIEAHGGMIGIESELGEGTTVTVTLPQSEERLVEAA